MNIPKEVLNIIKLLEKKNFEVYAVGGCVRDFLLNKEPKDWDITTSATPKQIQKIFPNSVYENQFGTVGIKTKSKKSNLKIIEVTTFRSDGKYSDSRHPDKIRFSKKLEDDLGRRDFTINAMVLKIKRDSWEIIDPYQGQQDLNKKIIKCVGDPEKRLQEDALRLMRAIRFNVELGINQGWLLETATFKAIVKNNNLIKNISFERVRDELIKIIATQEACLGIDLLHRSGLLKYILPELETGIDVGQNKHHLFTVWEHNLRSLDYAARNNYSLIVRLASLFHDIGKPLAKQGSGKDCTFYNHEILSSRITERILKRLHFSEEIIKKVVILVRYHGFFYEVETTTDASLRRLIINVGKENMEDLAQVREADRIGSGCPKALPFKLRHFMYRVEKILKENHGEQPSLKTLKINGDDLIKNLKIAPGQKIGYILNILLEETLDNPKLNTKQYLKKSALDLNKYDLEELIIKNKKAKEKYDLALEEFSNEIRKKYYV